MKKYLISLSFLAVSNAMNAQSATSSPYSMYGLGLVADQSQSFSRGMNGVGLAFRDNNAVNTLNPASYSAVDSITFVFDMGMSLQNTNYKEKNIKKNGKNASIEYAVGLFRLVKNVGMSFGILPYTNVGYTFSSNSKLDSYATLPATNTVTTHTQTFTGSGGLHEIFIGAGWQTPIKGFSVGLNAGYIWGDINRYVTSSYSDNNVKSLSRQYTSTSQNYKLDFGAQYIRKINDKYTACLGVTFTPGHRLGSDPELLIISASSIGNDTTRISANNGMSIPTEFGLGFALKHRKTWRVGLDYKYQAWRNADYPVYSEVNGKSVYEPSNTYYTDRHSLKAGGEYCKNRDSREFTDRLAYRFGVGYTTPHLLIGQKDGPKEISVSAGLGIPVVNSYNTRSVLNLGITWQNRKCNDFITENAFLINIGLTFNERWFAKWKFE